MIIYLNGKKYDIKVPLVYLYICIIFLFVCICSFTHFSTLQLFKIATFHFCQLRYFTFSNVWRANPPTLLAKKRACLIVYKVAFADVRRSLSVAGRPSSVLSSSLLSYSSSCRSSLVLWLSFVVVAMFFSVAQLSSSFVMEYV